MPERRLDGYLRLRQPRPRHLRQLPRRHANTYSYGASAPTASSCPALTAGAQTLDLQTYTDRLSRVPTYGYDCDRRLVEVDDPTRPTPAETTFAYAYSAVNKKGDGETVTRSDPDGQATSWLYDVEGRPSTKTFADASTLNVNYEASTSRVASVKDALLQVRQLGYYLDNRLASLTYKNPISPTTNVAFAYDANFPRLTSRVDTLTVAGTTTTQQTTYGYWPVGVLGALRVQTEIQPLAEIAYGYDQLGRLSSRG